MPHTTFSSSNFTAYTELDVVTVSCGVQLPVIQLRFVRQSFLNISRQSLPTLPATNVGVRSAPNANLKWMGSCTCGGAY
jgi:hypothetical protein